MALVNQARSAVVDALLGNRTCELLAESRADMLVLPTVSPAELVDIGTVHGARRAA